MSEHSLVIPSTLQRFRVPRRVLEDTAGVLRVRGAEGWEAIVLWLGTVTSSMEAQLLAAYVPDQIAYRSGAGLAVEVPQAERTRIALGLPRGVFVLAKVHSHAEHAYHSELDAANLLLDHEGAVAITVPYFARDGLVGLRGCSVNILRGGQWVTLSEREIAAAFMLGEVED